MPNNQKTTFADIEQKFHSMPLTKYEIPEALEAEWLTTAVSDYELNLGCDLGYNQSTDKYCYTHLGANDVCFISAKRAE